MPDKKKKSKKTTKKITKKKPPAKPKKTTAYQKTKAQYDKDAKAVKAARKRMNRMYSNAVSDEQMATVFNPANKKYWRSMRDKHLKSYEALKKKYNRANSKLNASQKKLDKLQKSKNNIDKISQKISDQKKEWRNEGTAAIYRTDGKNQNIVFISPGDTESEDTQANVTSYAVDIGSPRSNYARTSSKTIQVAGTITGYDPKTKKFSRRATNKKWKQLRYWLSRHTELTYRGSFTYHHLILSDAQQSFTNLKYDLKVSLTFTFVYAAEITTSTGKNSKAKKSKSSKTTAGTRNKNYTAITIKYGDTLLGLSRKYNKPVSWLMKVNNIKNPNKIYAGNTLYVSRKEAKKRKKARVK